MEHMPTTLIKKNHTRISIPVPLDQLAESIWQLPRKDREALEDVLEEKFVKTVLRRAREIPRMRREKRLLSLKEIEKNFSHG